MSEGLLRGRPLEKWWLGWGKNQKNSSKGKCPKKFLQSETQRKVQPKQYSGVNIFVPCLRKKKGKTHHVVSLLIKLLLYLWGLNCLIFHGRGWVISRYKNLRLRTKITFLHEIFSYFQIWLCHGCGDFVWTLLDLKSVFKERGWPLSEVTQVSGLMNAVVYKQNFTGWFSLSPGSILQAWLTCFVKSDHIRLN